MKTAVMVGDSHSQIVFPALKEMLEVNVLESVSKPGWGVKKFLNDYDLSTLPKADVYIIALGGNNQDMNVLSYIGHVDSFLGKIGQKTSKIVWISPFQADNVSVDDRHRETFRFLEQGLPFDVKYLDVYSSSAVVPTKDSMKVHYNRADYYDFARKIAPSIQMVANVPKVVLLLMKGKSLTLLAFSIVGFTLSLLVGNARDGR